MQHWFVAQHILFWCNAKTDLNYALRAFLLNTMTKAEIQEQTHPSEMRVMLDYGCEWADKSLPDKSDKRR